MTDQQQEPEAKQDAAEAPAAETPAVEAPAAEAPAPTADQAPAEGASADAEAVEAPVAVPPLAQGKDFVWGTGRRKKAVARVRIRPGTGKFIVNKREADQYFHHERDREAIAGPLRAANMLRSWDVWVNVGGGGYTGQAGAVVLGLARALAKAMPQVESALRDQGLMTRDARMKERKKPGQPGARRRFQFSKR